MRLVIASLLLARLAAAQPGPPPPVDTTGTETPTPPPNPPPAPPPAPPPMHHMMAEPHDMERPEGLSFAIGVGYLFTGTTSLQQPNVWSVRVRLPSGLTFEPLLKVQNASTDMQTDPNPTVSTTTTELALGTLVRYPLVQHGRVDFEGLGELLLDTVKTDPDGPDNDTRTTSFDLNWGIALGFWITHHWALSFNATNPLVAYTKTSMATGPTTSNSTTNTQFGLVFDPTVSVMIHLYN